MIWLALAEVALIAFIFGMITGAVAESRSGARDWHRLEGRMRHDLARTGKHSITREDTR